MKLAPNVKADLQIASGRHVYESGERLYTCTGRHCAGCGSHMPVDDTALHCSMCRYWAQILANPWGART